MSPTAVLLMLSSGLSFLPACFPLHYILVEKSSTWYEARSYCRERYIDLAPVHNQEDLAQLTQLTDESPDVWIGLQADPGTWSWSLEDPDYYAEGEKDYRNWAAGEPTIDPGERGCVLVYPNGEWDDTLCFNYRHFFCYDKNANGSIVYIDIQLSWEDAWRYCRTHHTNLASIRNQAENDGLNNAGDAWIGLTTRGWKWADGSSVSFTNWAPDASYFNPTTLCGASVSGQWTNDDCDNKKPFVCSAVPLGSTHTRVKVVLRRSGSSVDMEELQEGILEEFNRRVKQLGLNADVKLRWVKQSDGKIFHKQEEEEEEKEEAEEPTCPYKKKTHPLK